MSLKELIEELKKHPGVAKQKLKVKLAKVSSFKINVKAGKFKLVFDEEQIIGGSNEGPTPAHMLLASIGGCFLSTLQVWSQILDISINSAEVIVKGTIDALGMTGIDESAPIGFQNLTAEFKIESDEPAEKVKQLLDAAVKHCPVHHTIKSQTEINISLKEK
ncbi:MAG: OsmC family protein [Candidatus Helarchaeota archaeon]